MSGAATTAVGKSVGLTTITSGHSGLPLVTVGLTRIDTADFVEVGPRARTERGAEANLKGICTGIENECGGAAAARGSSSARRPVLLLMYSIGLPPVPRPYSQPAVDGEGTGSPLTQDDG